MRRKLMYVTLFGVGIVVTALYQTRKVHATQIHDHHQGCSVPSLKGTYAFHRTGQNNALGPIAQIGINVEDGEGRIKLIRTTRSQNGVILDWFEQVEPGSYTVDPDCTGSFLNKSQNIVVVDGGKRYFMLSADPGTTVTEEGTRIDDREE